MRNLTITYRMTGPCEEAESSIALPMTQEQADCVLEGNTTEALDAVLNGLARLQGYDGAEFYAVAEAE